MLATVRVGRTKYTFESKPPIMVLRGHYGAGKPLHMPRLSTILATN